MNASRIILQQARPALIVLASALLLGLALVIGSHYATEQQHETLQQQQQQTTQLQDSLSSRQAALKYIESHITRYRTLVQQGLLRSPDRENWAENLLATHKALQLPETLTYVLPPPQPMTHPDTVAAPATTGTETSPAADAPLIHDIQLTLNNIHEVELLSFLQRFQATLPERFRVQSCQLHTPSARGLTAECVLRFFTLPPPASPSVPAPPS